mmetsp:Transcript_13589/g.22442  ORF Transcript_13589/g.22442 Transcript_13589/m.22442 type:complete len:122 (-) Transcript_13589:37-402(-)|eukprot:CAMPEP_0169065536 /NCGR_PEP_ID=MMETSP1015-20121227/2459_1 /TAXON_ID=342587 /ORGANISM="Karlodinium micrum, Strain CCMP2283" /LENGTH=121 /DNA_ID=CAMNT_0009124123 /DNA_START=51 /DNA_END=416 /DNA_ORIENTATION=-
MPKSCCEAALKCNGIPPNYPKATQPIGIAALNGYYEDSECKTCKSHHTPFLGCCDCVCFFCGPIPFSGTIACSAGQNCYTNYQGYFITQVDENTIVDGCWPLCGASVSVKQGTGPKQQEMK